MFDKFYNLCKCYFIMVTPAKQPCQVATYAGYNAEVRFNGFILTEFMQ